MNEREDLASSVPPTVYCSALRCAWHFGCTNYDRRKEDFLGRHKDTSYAGNLRILYEEFEEMARSAYLEASAVSPFEMSTPAVPYPFAKMQRSPASRLIAACSHA